MPDADVVAFGIDGFCRVDVNPFGPVQLYVAPAIVEAVSCNVLPAQTGPLLLVVGGAGAALTVTLVVAEAEVQPLTVTVTLYAPEAAIMAFGIDGFCSDEVNPLGPVQLYVAPAMVEAESCNVLPAQIGPLLLAVGGAGAAFTTAVVVTGVEAQPFTVTVTLYVPDADVVVFGIDGFCCVEVNPFGPVQL
jgi:formaldehyde-activating enzyme involved in methanogenesis